MLAGWRNGRCRFDFSGLPQYLIQLTGARSIRSIRQMAFTSSNSRNARFGPPVVQFKDGYPAALHSQRNEIFYTGNEQRGVVFFLGDEPHLNIEVMFLLFTSRSAAWR